MGQLVTRTLGTLPRGDREDTRLTSALGEMGWLGLQIVNDFSHLITEYVFKY